MDRIGQRFGDYRLIRLIGQGGFADVYLGEHFRRKTLAAVKVLHMRLANDNVKGFLNEACSFRLRHPHIVQILDFGLEDDSPFLVMEYAPNGSLRQHHPKGTRLPSETIVLYVGQIADALEYAHEEGVVHRDIKPDNMLLGRHNEVLLSDFGIASIAHNTQSMSVQNQAGTVTYMAPEQLQGKPRPASDQYALGIVVYEWICGERPFHGSFAELYGQHLSVPPPSLRERIPSLPSEVEEVVMTALAKDPRHRFADVQAFANALEQAYKLVSYTSPASTFQEVVLVPETPGVVSPLTSPLEQPPVLIRSGLNNPIQPPSPEQPSSLLAGAPGKDANTGGITELQASPGKEASITEERNEQVSSPPFTLPEVFDYSLSNNLPMQEDANRHEARLMAVETGFRSGVLESPPDYPKRTDDVSAAVTMSFPVEEPETYTASDIDMSGDGKLSVSFRRKKRKFWLFSLLIIVVVVFIAGIAIAGTGGLGNLSGIPLGSSITTVTITPAKYGLDSTIEIFAVTGHPDPATLEVGARINTSTSQTQTKTVNATGSIPGLRATGALTFLNASNSTRTFNSVVLTGASGVPVSFDGPVTVPVVPGFITVTGFAVNVGSAGNIGALDMSGSCCAAGITVKNGAFSGGQDPQPNSVIQQSDINGAANALVASLTPVTQAALQKQVQPNEQVVPNTSQCNKATFTANQIAGDQAKTVTVTVALTCHEEVYDQQGALTMAANLLKLEASKDPGPAYGLTRNIVTGVTKTMVVDSKGTLSLLVKAEGVWVYLFSDAMKLNLAKNIAKKSKEVAIKYLVSQPGVSSVQIDISSGNTLPDAAHITIDIKPVPGATGTGTAIPSPGTPTVVPPGASTRVQKLGGS